MGELSSACAQPGLCVQVACITSLLWELVLQAALIGSSIQ